MKNIRHTSFDAQAEALTLVLARPSLLEMFLQLTDSGSINVCWNPNVEPPKWEGDHEPTEDDFRRMAAAKVLLEKGFLVAGGIDPAIGSYSLIATDEAMEVRKAYDSLPGEMVSTAKERFAKY
jgi:hypothetical protein